MEDMTLESNVSNSSVSLNGTSSSEASPGTAAVNPNFTVSEWCDVCRKHALEVEKRHKKTISIVKKKILCTDHLISMYTQMKSSFESSQNRLKTLEQECKRKETDNQLINTQLKAMLADKNPSELEKQKEENASLKQVVQNLNDQIKSMDMTKKMLDDKIESLRDEVAQKEVDWKKRNKEKDQLQKDVVKLKKHILSLEKENSALTKKNEVLQERLRRKKTRGSGSFSQTTDSEHNTTLPLEEPVKAKSEDTAKQNVEFKSPSTERRKKLKKRRRKSKPDGSDDEEAHPSELVVPVQVHISAVISNEDKISQSRLEEDSKEKKTVQQKETSVVDEQTASMSSDSSIVSKKPSSSANKAMKERVLAMRRQRSFRSFCHHPNGTQLRELSNIVYRLKESRNGFEDDINRFCQKHFLTGQEGHVVRKILKLHQETLSVNEVNELQNFASNLIATKDTVVKTKTEHHENLPVITSSVIVTRKDDDISAAKESSQTLENKNSEAAESQMCDASSPPPGCSSEKSKTETVSLPLEKDTLQPSTTPKPVDTTDAVEHREPEPPALITSMFSSDDSDAEVGVRENMQSVSPSAASPKEVTAHTTARRIRTRSVSKSFSENDDDAISAQVKGEDPSTRRRTRSATKSFEIVIQDDSETTYKERERTPSHEARRYTASITLSPSQKQTPNGFRSTCSAVVQDESHTFVKEQEKNCVSETSHVKPVVKQINNKLDISENSSKVAIYTRSNSKRRTSNDSCETTSKLRKLSSNETNNRSATKAMDMIDACSKTDSSSIFNEETGKAANDLETSVFEAEPKENMRVTLQNMQSLPFSVDDDDTSDESGTIGACEAVLSHFDQYAADLTSKSTYDDQVLDEDFVPDINILNSFFREMSMEFRTAPLSPLKSSLDEGESSSMQAVSSVTENTALFSDSLPPIADVDSDTQSSISPSANLCTALSFSSGQDNDISATVSSDSLLTLPSAATSEETDGLNQLETKPGSSEANMAEVAGGEPPRRFSCEAPVCAMPVPPLKQVQKTKSLDPYVASQLEVTPSRTSIDDLTQGAKQIMPTESQNELTKSQFQGLPQSLTKLTHTYTSPFKLVDVGTEEFLENNGDKTKVAAQACHLTPIPPPSKKQHQLGKRATSQKVAVTVTAISPLQDILLDIQSFAAALPGKTFSAIPLAKVLTWLANIAHHCSGHHSSIPIANYLAAKASLAGIKPRDILHSREYDFVVMIKAVNEKRSKEREIIESLMIPAVLKIICRFGPSASASSKIFSNEPSLINVFSGLLKKGKLDPGHVYSLVRILSTLCCSIGFARGPIDLCRHALLACMSEAVGNILYDAVACYPQAFTKHYPLCGKIILFSLFFQAEKYCYSDTSESFRENIRRKVNSLELLLGRDGNEDTFKLSEGADPDSRWRNILDICVKRIESAKLVRRNEEATCADAQKPSVIVVSIENRDDVLFALEFISYLKWLEFTSKQIIEKLFWTRLNAWSQHLHLHSNSDENKPVSDACMMATLQALTAVLSPLVTRQIVRHITQKPSRQAVAYYEVICSLVMNFSRDYIDKAPIFVQCAAAITVLKLSYCKPPLAYSSLHEWLIATKGNKESAQDSAGTAEQPSGNAHPQLPQLLALCPEKKIRRIVSWLDLQKQDQKPTISLRTLLWG